MPKTRIASGFAYTTTWMRSMSSKQLMVTSAAVVDNESTGQVFIPGIVFRVDGRKDACDNVSTFRGLIVGDKSASLKLKIFLHE